MRVRLGRMPGTVSLLPYIDILFPGRCVAFGWLFWTVSVDWSEGSFHSIYYKLTSTFEPRLRGDARTGLFFAVIGCFLGPWRGFSFRRGLVRIALHLCARGLDFYPSPLLTGTMRHIHLG